MISHNFPRFLALFSIRLYQKTLSFDHGFFRRLYPNGYCRFHPTCSEYGYRAVEKYGVVRGGWMAIQRILRCNPFSKGGVDKLK